MIIWQRADWSHGAQDLFERNSKRGKEKWNEIKCPPPPLPSHMHASMHTCTHARTHIHTHIHTHTHMHAHIHDIHDNIDNEDFFCSMSIAMNEYDALYNCSVHKPKIVGKYIIINYDNTWSQLHTFKLCMHHMVAHFHDPQQQPTLSLHQHT